MLKHIKKKENEYQSFSLILTVTSQSYSAVIYPFQIWRPYFWLRRRSRNGLSFLYVKNGRRTWCDRYQVPVILSTRGFNRICRYIFLSIRRHFLPRLHGASGGGCAFGRAGKCLWTSREVPSGEHRVPMQRVVPIVGA